MIFTEEEQDKMRNYPQSFYGSMFKLVDEIEKLQKEIKELKFHDKTTQDKLEALKTKIGDNEGEIEKLT